MNAPFGTLKATFEPNFIRNVTPDGCKTKLYGFLIVVTPSLQSPKNIVLKKKEEKPQDTAKICSHIQIRQKSVHALGL